MSYTQGNCTVRKVGRQLIVHHTPSYPWRYLLVYAEIGSLHSEAGVCVHSTLICPEKQLNVWPAQAKLLCMYRILMQGRPWWGTPAPR